MTFCETDDAEISKLEKILGKYIGENKVLERRNIVEKSHGNCSTPEKYQMFLKDYKTDLTRNIRYNESINGKAY